MQKEKIGSGNRFMEGDTEKSKETESELKQCNIQHFYFIKINGFVCVK